MERVLLGLVYLFSACLAEGGGEALYKQAAAVYKSDPAQAFGLFVQAAEAGNLSAMVGAGHGCETGIGTTVDYATAIEWYEKAVAHNSLKACEGLARIYASCDDPEFHDGEKAVKYASAIARKKPRDANALSLLAAAHARNIDFEKAVKIQTDAVRYCSLEQAVEFKQRIKEYGCGIPLPDTAAEVWILAAADRGLPWGMFMQGMQCQNVQEDGRAVEWYTKAVAVGVSDAAIVLGDCHWQGVGTPVNYIKSFECYEAAQETGASLGEAREKRVSSFAKVWEDLEHTNKEDCFSEAQRGERWINGILSQANPREEKKIAEIRAALMERVMYCFAIADAKGHPGAAAEFERVRGIVEGSSKASPSSEARPRRRVSRTPAERLINDAVECRSENIPKKEFDLYMESYKLDPTANNGYAAYCISHFYLKGGDGIPKDKVKSQEWRIKAADAGHSESLINVVARFAMGNDGGEVDCDAEKAMHYTRILLPMEERFNDYRYWDVIAAAYARSGEFDNAIKYQDTAIEVLNSDSGRINESEKSKQRRNKKMLERRDEYEARRPFAYKR